MWEAKDRLSTELYCLSFWDYSKRRKKSRPMGMLLLILIFQLFSYFKCLPYCIYLPFLLPFAVMPLMLLFSTWSFVFHQCSNKSLIFQASLDVQMTICMWKMRAHTILQLPINIRKYEIGGCSMQFSALSLCPVLFNLLLAKHATMHIAEVVHAFSL